MKKIIDGHRYDSDTARFLGSYCAPGNWRDFRHYEEELYITRAGLYFLHGEGGPMTRYAVQVESSGWTGGEKIIPLSESAAKEWAEEHLDGDEYEKIFGEVDEPEITAVTAYLPDKMVERIDALKGRASRSAVIIAALEKYLAE